MKIVLFGANNPSGAALLALCNYKEIEIWGRTSPANNDSIPFNYCDLSNLSAKTNKPITGILISFSPIWLLAPFLLNLRHNEPEIVKGLEGIIACSSSSFITKRFAFNEYDKNLSQSLIQAHEKIRFISSQLKIPFQVIAPTLVYGQVKQYADKNISSIYTLMRILPLIILPSRSGLRQPIHANQLASVAKHQADKMWSGDWNSSENEILCIGGDICLSYQDMLLAVRDHSCQSMAVNCLIITIPNRLFSFLAAPLLLLSPKSFEAVMRIQSNLSGFTKAHEILEESPKSFPVLPLAAKTVRTN
jgi:hypothetical protein